MNDAVLIRLIEQLPMIIGAIVSGLAAYFAYKANRQGKETAEHVTKVEQSVNGQAEKLLALTRTASKAEGVKEELERIK